MSTLRSDLVILRKMTVWIAIRIVVGFTLLTLFSQEGWECPDATMLEAILGCVGRFN